MNIYDLNNSYYLRHDIEEILEKVSSLYDIEFKVSSTTFTPKTIVSNKFNWASQECNDAFNKIVPVAKSLTKDMYAVLETLYKSEKGKFDKLKLEEKHSGLLELRLLNNKIKHYFDKIPKISLTQLTFIEQRGHGIDIFVNYDYLNGKYDSIRFTELIKTFLLLLEDLKIVNIDRT